jgi:hypothetical protein
MNSQELRNLQEAYLDVYRNIEEPEQLDEIMKHQQERDRIEGMKKKSSRAKTWSYEPPTKGKHGEIERRQAQRPPSRLRRSGKLPESYDLYDVILSHLLDEGYAETPEAAEVIMVNMSEDWRESIVEGLGGFQNPERVQRRLNKIEADIKKGEEMYASGQLPYQRQEKAQKAQEFLKRHPKKKK